MDTSSDRIYQFDDFFIELFSLRLFQRKSPGLDFKVNRTKRTYCVLTIGFLEISLIFLAMVQDLRSEQFNLPEIIENAAVLGGYVTCSSRGFGILLNYKSVEKLLRNLENLFPDTKVKQLNYGLQDYAQRIIRFNNIIKRAGVFAILVFNALKILLSLFNWAIIGNEYDYQYQIKMWFPIDVHNMFFYPFLYTLQIIISINFILFLINDDVHFLLSVSQVCMHFKYLGKKLSQVNAKEPAAVNANILKTLIQYQICLEELVDDINDVFNVTAFISFGVMKITICIFMFAISYGTEILVLFSTGILLLLFSIYVRCYHATELNTASSSLVDALYEHNWFERTPKYRKTVVIIMIKANRPMELHALKINIIGMEYFKEFTVQTYQVFMFLYNFILRPQ